MLLQTLRQQPLARKIQRATHPARRAASPPVAVLRPRPREHHHAGRAHEQRRAAMKLRAIAPNLRVTADPEGWPVIPARYGQIEYHDGIHLTAFTARRLVRGRLLAVPGVVRHQVGDEELRVVFPAEAFPAVAAVLRARRRRHGRPMTSQEAARLRARRRVGASPATQELVGGPAEGEIPG